VTGYFEGTVDFDPGPGVFNLTSAGIPGYSDIFVLKLDAAGNFLWARSIRAAEADSGYGIAVAADGTVYVAEGAGEVVGTFTLVLEERTPPPLWPILRRHLGFGAALRAFVLLQLMGTSHPDPHTALVEAVAVLPEWRGRGVGRQMMAEALALARRAGRQRVGLYVVEGNAPALRLYTSLGFRVQRAHRLLWARPLFGAQRILYMTADLGRTRGAPRA
ncbi:MAG: GNAT family N-acetyltransferase, partial [Firmicutes bacterium]|nr:GNAT family N-acetyltransferase [Bacillota bacterium]